MMDDMARNADHALAKPHGIARLSTSRGHRRALLHRSARKQTRAWRRQSPKTPGNTGCCIRSKSSRFQAHPFREGNGRTSKIYMQHVAELSPFRLDFSHIDPTMWNLSSELSRPSPMRPTIDATYLYPAFAAATRPATQAPPAAAPQQGIGPRSASYPRAATAAPQQPPQLSKPAAGYTPKQQPYRGPGRTR